MSEFYV